MNIFVLPLAAILAIATGLTSTRASQLPLQQFVVSGDGCPQATSRVTSQFINGKIQLNLPKMLVQSSGRIVSKSCNLRAEVATKRPLTLLITVSGFARGTGSVSLLSSIGGLAKNRKEVLTRNGAFKLQQTLVIPAKSQSILAINLRAIQRGSGSIDIQKYTITH
jgi:hypothetical protein